LSDHRSDFGSPFSFSATATEHGCRLIPAVSLHRQLSLAPLLQSMAGNISQLVSNAKKANAVVTSALASVARFNL